MLNSEACSCLRMSHMLKCSFPILMEFECKRVVQLLYFCCFFFQAEDGIRDLTVTWSSDVCSSDLLSDLTEIVELQNRIKFKENFAALGEMSAGIAHEFKNSLATILGYAQLSTEETSVVTLQNYAREIHKESRALSRMVTDFLNFARPVSISMYDVDLNELLTNAITDVRNLRPGSYVVRFAAANKAVVACDPILMRQSFLNLLINAVEALNGETGGIAVSVDAVKERGYIRVLIEDDGRGIPHDIVSKIFLPFFTTKTHGTGLGLSLVQKIVLAHNGRIQVQSAEGEGTRFTITLPKLITAL